MKKILVIIIMVLSILVGNRVESTTFHQFFPEGKNYINPENLILENNVLSLVERIVIKSDTTYSITFPGFEHYENVTHIYVGGVYEYMNDDAESTGLCDVRHDSTTCTFTTDINEIELYISIEATDIGIYKNYAGNYHLQLEEGSVYTGFEEYIIPLVDSVSPEFSGAGGFITSYQEITLLSSIIDNHIIVIDEIDGDLSHLIQIEQDYYTGNEQIVGEYDTLLSVSDLSGNISYFTLTLMVKDEVPPVFDSDMDIYVDVDNNELINSILLESIIYSDEYDDLPILEVINDLYTSNEAIVGNYTLELKITDSSGNSTLKQFLIHVEDKTAPTIQNTDVQAQNINNPRLIVDIVNELVIEDNYDINPQINIIDDGYTNLNTEVGKYFVIIEVTDFSGNINQFTLEIDVVDQDSPIIEGPSSINFSYQETKSLDEILNMISVSDNYTTLTNEDLYIISDSYTNRESTTGEYLIILGIRDGQNNETQKEISVSIYDDILPIIFIDDYIVVLDKGTTFSEEDALKLLVRNNTLFDKEYKMTILLDEYSGNEKIDGTYLYKIEFEDDLGDKLVKEFVIEVNNEYDNKKNIVRYSLVSGIIVLYTGFVIYKKRR